MQQEMGQLADSNASVQYFYNTIYKNQMCNDLVRCF